MEKMLTADSKSKFEKDGYLLLSDLFSAEEIAALSRFVQGDQQLAGETYGKRDATGNETRLAVRNQLDDSPCSAIVRSERVAGTMTQLLGDEVYHYHHKLMVKEPKVGGAGNGTRITDIGTIMVACFRTWPAA